MPRAPWVMTQTWRHLLFAHWPIAADVLRSLVPAAFEIDRFDGQAWLGIVPFEMSNVVPRGVRAIERLSTFPELNVRTYVRHRGVPGVYFFSLDADNRLVVADRAPLLSPAVFPGRHDHRNRLEATSVTTAGGAARPRQMPRSRPGIRRWARLRSRWLGTLEYFLTERYCLFTVNRSGKVLRVDIHHPPWTLQPADAEFSDNTMAAAAGITLPDTAPLLHVAGRQDVVAWMPVKADD